MINNLEYLNAPHCIVILIVAFFVALELIKGATYVWGLIAPKIFKIQTNVSRKRKMDELIVSNQTEIKEIKESQEEDRKQSKKADKEIRQDVSELKNIVLELKDQQLSMRIEQMRKSILDFASAIGSGRVYSKEQYKFMIKQCAIYEELIVQNHLTNGEVEISSELISEKYKYNLEHGEFLEDIFKKEHSGNNN